MKVASFSKIVLVVFFFILIISCTKSDDPGITPQTPTQVPTTGIRLFGYVTGSSSNAGVVTPITFILEANGKIVAAEATILYKNPIGIGTWKLTGTDFDASYTTNGVVTNIKTTYDPATGKLVGTIGTGISRTDKGTLVMQVKIPTKTGEDSVIGYYVGHFNGTGNFVMLLESGGKMKAGGDVINFYDAATSSNGFGDGTWTMVNNQVSATYTYPKTNFTVSWTGNFDDRTKIITGTWGIGTSTGSGSFTLGLQN